MRTQRNEQHLTTEQRLTLVLSAMEEPLRTELERFFWLSNPIEFAGKLISLELPLDVTRELLLTKVSQPKSYDGPDITMLCERTMQKYCNRLSEERGNV